MPLFKTPEWLQYRKILKNDLVELQRLFLDKGTPVIGDLTVELLKHYYQTQAKILFYKAVRVLGFYGVIFTGRLSAYSGSPSEEPEVLSIALKHHQKRITDYIGMPSSALLKSCGIETFEQLNGVPVQSLKKLLDCIPSFEDFFDKIPVEIVPATSNFFLPPEQADIIQQTNNKHDKETDEILCQSINILNLSVRSSNCLSNKGIETIGQLIRISPEDLLKIKNFGRKSLREISSKLSKYDLKLGSKTEIDDSFGIDLENEETLINLTSSIRDLILSVRTRNALDSHHVEYIWQVVSFTEKQLLQIKNFGRTSLNELKKRLSELGLYLGAVFSPEQIIRIQSFTKDHSETELDGLFLAKLNNRFSQIIFKLQQNPLPFLDKRENLIAHERLWPATTKRTLEDLASELKVTRERIRQIEKKTRSKIKQQYRKVLRDIVRVIHSTLSNQGNLGSISHLPIILSPLDKRTQFIISELITLIDERIFFDWDFDLVSVDGKSRILNICSSIRKSIQKSSSGKFFSQHVLDEAVLSVIRQYALIEDIVRKPITKKVRFAEKISLSRNLYCFGRVTKQDQAVQIFKKQFPEGLNIHKQAEHLLKKMQELDPKTFEDTNPRAIISRIVDHPDIFLWGRGFYIHRENVSFDMDVVYEAANWIIKRFDQSHSKFHVGLPYSKFMDNMLAGNIPNEYALYTLLRMLNNERIGQRKFPTLVDRLSDINFYETVSEELENYLLSAQGSVPYTQLKNEFIDKRGWQYYRLQMNLSSQNEKIFPWKNHSYIHLDFLSVDYQKLDELIDEIREKLSSIQGAYSLKGALQEFQVLWYQVCPEATIATMIKLIRSVEPADLEIDHYLIYYQQDNVTEFISQAAEMEDYFIEQDKEITTFELKKEFQEIRGWADNQYYGALRKATLFQASNNSFVHPSTINWSSKLSEQVYVVLSERLQKNNNDGIPHVVLSEIIDEYVLPKLPHDIEWTIDLLKSAGMESGDYLFFDDACILLENKYDIEDLDDMIAYLICRSVRLKIAKKKEVEKLLWREGILASGRKLPVNDIFFPESSIKYFPDSDEIMISQIGEERYGFKKPAGHSA